MKFTRKKGLGYIAEDVANLPEPPDDVVSLIGWLEQFRAIRERASAMVPKRNMHERSPTSSLIQSAYRAFRWKRCECCLTDRNLTAHHCVPVAVGGRDKDTVTLCRRCHNRAHALWGPGDSYTGPATPYETLRMLRLDAAKEQQ